MRKRTNPCKATNDLERKQPTVRKGRNGIRESEKGERTLRKRLQNERTRTNPSKVTRDVVKGVNPPEETRD